MSVKAIRADLNEKSFDKFQKIKEANGFESDAEAIRYCISKAFKLEFPNSQE